MDTTLKIPQDIKEHNFFRNNEKIQIINFNARKYGKMKSLKISFSLPVDFESNKFVT